MLKKLNLIIFLRIIVKVFRFIKRGEMNVYNFLYSKFFPVIEELFNRSSEEIMKLHKRDIRELKRVQKQLSVVIKCWETKANQFVSLDVYEQREIERREAILGQRKIGL